MSLKSTVLFSSLCVAVLATPMATIFAQEQGGVPGIQPAAVETEMSEEEMIRKASTILIYNRLGQMLVQLKRDGIELDQEAGLEGARLALAGEPIGISMQDAQTIMMKMQKRAQANAAKRQAEMKVQMEALAAENKAKGNAYLAENAKKEGVKTLDNGVQYEVMVAGTGPIPKPTDKVKINYHGMFIDGKVFDSTTQPTQGQPVQPYEAPANAFVPGFNAAIQAMPVGSKWRISIPSDQAYKMGGRGMEPNKTLIFEVEMLEILDGGAEAAPAAAGQ